QYRVLEYLDKGGMGYVLRAEDCGLQRCVALKIMRGEIADIPGARERFFREAQAVASLKHAHIVTIHQVSEAHGVPYLAMEFLEGESLHARLRRSQRRLPIADILRIGREAAEGLAAAHERGLVHRDIKPANIW